MGDNNEEEKYPKTVSLDKKEYDFFQDNALSFSIWIKKVVSYAITLKEEGVNFLDFLKEKVPENKEDVENETKR